MPVRLNGSTSGYVELAAPAVAGTTSLELPTDSIKPGLVLVAAESFSAVSSVSVNNCFTATYQNYRLLLKYAVSGAGVPISYRLRVAGSDDTSSSYVRQVLYATSTTVAGNATTTTSGEFAAGHNANGGNVVSMDLFDPQVAAVSGFSSLGHRSDTVLQVYSGIHNVSSGYDGITVFPSSGTFTGTLRVYGYRNSL